jgi:hypothetical protein
VNRSLVLPGCLDWLDRQRDGIFWSVLYLVRWPVIIPVSFVQGLLVAGVLGGRDAWKPEVGGAALLVPIILPPILETLIECTLPYWILKRLGRIASARPWTFILISASMMALLHFPVAVSCAFVTGMFLAYCYGHFAIRGHDRLRIGSMFTLSILDNDVPTLEETLRALCASAEAADGPVFICLDGQNWWQTRPDLWNWWDPSLPGFDPKNRFNVEWTGWGPEFAVKVGWRNWGRQHRVRPAQNILSARVLQEYRARYDMCIPILVKWYESLPSHRKYLFGGVKLGWEASTNVNAHYYPEGNRIFEQYPRDTSHDPTGTRVEEGWTMGTQPLGYAAVYSAGIRRSGTLTKADIEEVVHRYLRRLCRQASELGLPRHLIFTHQGGVYAPWERHLSFKPAMNEYSIPGWSFYTRDPHDCGPLAAELEAAGRTQWAAVEWWRGAADQSGWRERFERTLRFKRCRLIGVYNWRSFQTQPGALAAVAELVRRTVPPDRPSCSQPAAQ